MNGCLARDCPGDVDLDGFCLKWGHRCPGQSGDQSAGSSGVAGQSAGSFGRNGEPVGSSGAAVPAGTGDPATSGGQAGTGAGAGATSGGGGAGHGWSGGGSGGGFGGSGAGLGGSGGVAGPSGGGNPTPGGGGTRRWFGLVEMPVVPPRDPLAAIRADHAVPEHARICARSSCRRPVGRTDGTETGLTTGFCPYCGTPFSFVPPLHDGDVIKQRYRIKGCVGYGGMGWIFAARDEDMDGSWRVLKRQRAAEDSTAAEAFVGERRALIALDHPNIVKIYDFVPPEAGDGTPYIVMEFVGGQSLDEMRPRPAGWGVPGPLPLPQVLAYGLAILDAFDHLHDQDWLYCDLKPDNVMHVGNRLKLLDLGAARRAGDLDSPLLGTRGFEAPEVHRHGARAASVRSDLYTVGRTLGALSLAANTSQYLSRFPDGRQPETVPQLLEQHESYRRLLLRATDPDPDRRFGSAAEMYAQVHGVLRQVLAEQGQEVPPEASTLFGLAPRPFGAYDDLRTPLPAATVATALPAPLMDLADPGAGFLGSIGALQPAELIALLGRAPERSRDVLLRLTRAYLDAGQPELAAGTLTELAAQPGAPVDDWRLDWHRGLVALAAGEIGTAREHFDSVYGRLPGELVSRLGYAVASELDGDLATAERHYAAVWATERSSLSALFGLARTRLRQGDRRGAATALDQVPEAASHRLPAQIAKVRALLGAVRPDRPEADELVDAASTVKALDLTGAARDSLTAEVLEVALAWRIPQQPSVAGMVFDVPLVEDRLRERLAEVYRSLARQSVRRRERIALVDRANRVRPWTWL
ncbi:serine/threonine-protein kinase PknG [Micromonospora pisi]|uniref:non-specific serine/threonine protein kinase n=1 Tax=Micromonospora pisi TaxID=589240 RepID=A0A495JI31_9ACTN|nr:serine/threonine-protein kinase [Micromonospora pisi]RKR88666.1 serine/threonine-protein kinase PknG [Micromonospora pisi]